MQLVEQHVISKGDARYAVIDAAAFASKNLYNAANYVVRQAYIFEHRSLPYEEVYHLMKGHEAYKALPAKVAQHVLKLLDKNWKSYFAACLVWNEHPEKFLGHPKLPKYKDKISGRNVLVYTIQAMSRLGLKRGVIQPSGLPIEVQTKQTTIAQVRIVPRSGFYVVEVVYEAKEQHTDVDASLIAGIDIGLNNLATLTSNKSGFVPRIVNGRPVKSINQYYNKERARLQSCLPNKHHTTHQLDRLTIVRTRRINQNFVQVPHARFIDMLTYKAKLVGIQVILTEESYTSKCSFLDHEEIKKHEVYAGKRVKRGLFRSGCGKFIHADVNGAYNIMRKVAPDAFAEGVEDCVVNPVRLATGVQS